MPNPFPVTVARLMTTLVVPVIGQLHALRAALTDDDISESQGGRRNRQARLRARGAQRNHQW